MIPAPTESFDCFLESDPEPVGRVIHRRNVGRVGDNFIELALRQPSAVAIDRAKFNLVHKEGQEIDEMIAVGK